jgi:hypothetical protein
LKINNPGNPNLKNPSAQDYSREQEDFLALTYAVFNINREGKEWLAFMKEAFLEKLPVADPTKDDHHAYYREGQNSIIRSIPQNIKAYEEVMKKNNQTWEE